MDEWILKWVIPVITFVLGIITSKVIDRKLSFLFEKFDVKPTMTELTPLFRVGWDDKLINYSELSSITFLFDIINSKNNSNNISIDTIQVDILDYEEDTGQMKLNNMKIPAKGGDFPYKKFSAKLDGNKECINSKRINTDNKWVYISLAPGESDRFMLSLEAQKKGYYKVRVLIEYKNVGKSYYYEYPAIELAF